MDYNVLPQDGLLHEQIDSFAEGTTPDISGETFQKSTIVEQPVPTPTKKGLPASFPAQESAQRAQDLTAVRTELGSLSDDDTESSLPDVFTSEAIAKYANELPSAHDNDTARLRYLHDVAAGYITDSNLNQEGAIDAIQEVQDRLDVQHLKTHLPGQVRDLLVNSGALVRSSGPDENKNYHTTEDSKYLPDIKKLIKEGNMEAIYHGLGIRAGDFSDANREKLDQIDKGYSVNVPGENYSSTASAGSLSAPSASLDKSNPEVVKQMSEEQVKLAKTARDIERTRQIMLEKGLVASFLDQSIDPPILRRPTPDTWSSLVQKPH